jgi:hypothetical protein
VVVPRPNAATISDKMNVVYRGVVNPMSISLLVFLTMMFLLLQLTKVGNGKYNMSPGGGTEVSVSGKMSDGKVATDKKSIQNKRYSRSNRNN